MTAVVAVRDDKRNIICIGADSLGSNGAQSSRIADPKIFKNGEFIFAFAGSYRSGQLLSHRFQPPPLPKSNKNLVKYMVNEFMEALRECLSKAGRVRKEADTELAWMLEFIVVVRGHIFAIQEDFAVLENMEGYAAAGSGESYAIGSLFSTKGLSPDKRVRMALAAAEAHDPNVGGPFILKSVKVKQ